MTIEALFDAPAIYFRLSAPYTTEVVRGELTEHDGTYSGTADVLTACGWKTMTLTAKME